MIDPQALFLSGSGETYLDNKDCLQYQFSGKESVSVGKATQINTLCRGDL